MGAEMDCCDSTDDGRRFYVVFDLGGMIFLLTGLLLHTIHNLEAEGVVFYSGKVDVLRLINATSGWSGVGERKVMEGWFYASPVAVQAQGAVTDMDELEMLAAELGPLSKKAGSKVSFLQLGSLRTSFLGGECYRNGRYHTHVS